MDRSTIIVVPVLARPHRVSATMETVEAATPEPHRLLFVVTEDDTEELAELEVNGADHLVVPVDRVSYPAKVNDAYRATVEPLLFLAADDLRFHAGWLSAAFGQLAHAEVVGTNDLGNPRVMEGAHSTHTLVTRSYCDRPGATIDRPRTVLHEGYRHWYCDDELVGVAQHRGVWAHAADSLVEHLHPYHGKAERDATYRAGESRRFRDRRIYLRRCHRWGGS